MPKQSAKQASSVVHKHQLSWRIRVLIVALAAICLIVANSAIWFKRYIFTTGTFTTTASQALLSDSSREAMASEITDRLLEKRPLLKSTIDDRVQKLVAALLGTDLSTRAVEKSVSVLQTAVTSKDPEPIAIDLSGIKDTITNVLTVVRQRTDRSPDDYRIDLANIPDKIVLLDPTKLPNIYNIGVVAMWLGPLALLLALGSLGYLIYEAKGSRPRLIQILTIEGAIVLLAAILTVLLGPLLKPPVLAQVTSPSVRIVIENLYDAFITPFNKQAGFIFLLGITLLGTALGLYVVPRLTSSSKTKAA